MTRILTALSSLGLSLAPWALAAVLGAVLWTFTPWIGPAARYARLDDRHDVAVEAARRWEGYARGWMTSFHAAEAIRQHERADARQAVDQLSAQCDARVETARRSAVRIEHIVTKEPTYDPNRCPVRSLVDPGQLRDALAPAD